MMQPPSLGLVTILLPALVTSTASRTLALYFAGSEGFGALPIQRKTVRSEISKPSILSCPPMRGAPQMEFSAAIRKITSRNSSPTGFLPNENSREPQKAQRKASFTR